MPLLQDIQSKYLKGRSFLRDDPPGFHQAARGALDRTIPLEERVRLIREGEERLQGEDKAQWALSRGRRAAALGGAVTGASLLATQVAAGHINRTLEPRFRNSLGRQAATHAERVIAATPEAVQAPLRAAVAASRDDPGVVARGLTQGSEHLASLLRNTGQEASYREAVATLPRADRLRLVDLFHRGPTSVGRHRVGGPDYAKSWYALREYDPSPQFRDTAVGRLVRPIQRAGSWLSEVPAPLMNALRRGAAAGNRPVADSAVREALVDSLAPRLLSRGSLLTGAAALGLGAVAAARAARNPSVFPGTSEEDLPEKLRALDAQVLQRDYDLIQPADPVASFGGQVARTAAIPARLVTEDMEGKKRGYPSLLEIGLGGDLAYQEQKALLDGQESEIADLQRWGA